MHDLMRVGDGVDIIQRHGKEWLQVVFIPRRCHRLEDLIWIQVMKEGRRVLVIHVCVDFGQVKQDAAERQWMHNHFYLITNRSTTDHQSLADSLIAMSSGTTM